MRAVKRWRYYCDWCKKSGGRKDAMEQHEKHCTLNPDRHCRMCVRMEKVQPPLTAMITRLTLKTDRLPMLADIRFAAVGCPACMLALIRQHVQLMDFEASVHDDEHPLERWVSDYHEFDYKQEAEAVLTNIAKMEEENQPNVSGAI